MMNKKILAVAVAAAFTTNVSAMSMIDLDAGTGVITIATESVSAGDVDVDGLLEVSNPGLGAKVVVGFTINEGTSNFVRIDLTNSVFNGDVPAITTDGDDVDEPDFSADISIGGNDGDDYVIFEVVDPSENILNTDVFTLVTDSYDVLAGSTATMKYTLYDTGTGAINELENDILKEGSAVDYVAFGSAIDESGLTIGNVEESTVQSTFTEFSDAFSTFTASMGIVDITNTIVPGTMTADGDVVDESHVYTADQDFSFTGDFSFGTWYVSKDGCATVNETIDLLEDPVVAFDVDVSDLLPISLCVQADGTETINKSTAPYTVTLVTDELSGDLGGITYNTTSIFVPYVTTFDEYNQRIYIQNDGTTDASYSISFDVEVGNIPTSLAGALDGVAPAGHIKMIRVNDIVSFDKFTRGSATIEIEASAENLKATMQTVNTNTKTTDTVILEVDANELILD